MLEAPWWAAASAGDVLGVVIDLVCCASVYAQLFLDLRTAANLKMTWAEKAETFPLSHFPSGAGTASAPAPDLLDTHHRAFVYTPISTLPPLATPPVFLGHVCST